MNALAVVNTPVQQCSTGNMPNKGFADRLAYLRWLWALRTRDFGSGRAFADFAGVGYELYMKWKDRPDAPSDRHTARAFLAGGLASLGAAEGWLLDGEGDAPEPPLWTLWSARRAVKVADLDPPTAKGRKRHG